jgi:bifunctional ADP-heptose synthase (sugar kinase/adenylyltransferase)
LETAVRLANSAAGVAVGKLGAATVTLDELRDATGVLGLPGSAAS